MGCIVTLLDCAASSGGWMGLSDSGSVKGCHPVNNTHVAHLPFHLLPHHVKQNTHSCWL